MSVTPPAWLERRTARIHRWLYRRTHGRLGGAVGRDGRPVALLTTTGRRTGQPREWPLLCLADGDRHLVVASNAGRDHHPAWLLNLRADPTAVLQVGADRCPVRAREATASESAALWPRLDDMYDGYADYRASTDRDLPIVILEPVHDQDRTATL